MQPLSKKNAEIVEKERGIGVVRKGKGIYQLTNDPISMQIIVNTQLSPKENVWLCSLKRDLAMDINTKRLLREYKGHRESNLYQAAMDLIMRANQKTMEEAGNMVCDAIKEIFADEWKKQELKFQEKEVQFQEKEVRFQEKEVQFQEKELRLQEKESQINEKESQINEKESQMQKKEIQLKRLENRMETLIQLLINNNLLDDLKKISMDKTYREQMYQRYGL